MRHTAASLAISAGANVKAVQRMSGHASAAVTLDVYFDLFESDLDGVAVALEEQILCADVAEMLPRGGGALRQAQGTGLWSDIYVVPPGRFELPPLPPEGSALSPELWGPRCVTRLAASGRTSGQRSGRSIRRPRLCRVER
jgi:hypothetical protein